MPKPSVDIIMVEDQPYSLTRNETISILTDQDATIQVTGKNSSSPVTLQPDPITEGAYEFNGFEGTFLGTAFGGGGETSFTRNKTPQA